MRIITISISVPDGVEFRVTQGPPPDDFEHEPLPVETFAADEAYVPNGHAQAPVMGTVAVAAPVQAPSVCPNHHQPWKLVPAGISKKTQKPYDAFWTCPVNGCKERPR